MDLSDTHHLGVRAFFLFLGRHIKWPLILLVVLVLLWTQRGLVPPGNYTMWADFWFEVICLAWVGFMIFILFSSYFEYRGYSYRFDDEYFHVTNGYITKNETGVVYHQIQHVTIKRGIFDRLIGVSNLIIVMNLTGGNPSTSHIVLPALNKNKAKLVHRELLRKAYRRTKGTEHVSSDSNEDVEDSVEEE